MLEISHQCAGIGVLQPQPITACLIATTAMSSVCSNAACADILQAHSPPLPHLDAPEIPQLTCGLLGATVTQAMWHSNIR
jgi:hypothetical protein